MTIFPITMIDFVCRFAARLSRRAIIGRCLAVCVAGLFALSGMQSLHAADDIDKVQAQIKKHLPDIDISSIADTPIDGVYEMISGGQIYYVGNGGQHLLDGDIIDLSTRENLTNTRLGGIHIELINAVEEGDMLVYEPDNYSGRSITVFTDTSCGFCRKLHQEIDQILDAGIAVRYLLFPRAGLGSAAHKNLESVWCSDNPQEAMTVAKSGGNVKGASCSNPIESHVALAEQVGLRGTPLIYLDTGRQIPGYRPANELVQLIEQGEPTQTN